MKLGLQMAGAFLVTVTLATAASTRFVSTWKNPEAAPLDATAVKMATFVISSDDTMRWGPEETLAAELRRRRGGRRCRLYRAARRAGQGQGEGQGVPQECRYYRGGHDADFGV